MTLHTNAFAAAYAHCSFTSAAGEGGVVSIHARAVA
jgi:hypothetical protein